MSLRMAERSDLRESQLNEAIPCMRLLRRYRSSQLRAISLFIKEVKPMNNKKRWTILMIIVLASVMLNSLVLAVDMEARELAEPYRSTSLRDLIGVRVLLTDLNPDAERDGLIKRELQTDVELRLRKSGIRVLTEEEWRKMPRAPLLYVRVDALKGSNIAYTYYTDVQLYQRVSIEQTPDISGFAATWSTGSTGIAEQAKLKGLVFGSLRNEVDEFIKAYLAENLK